MAKLNTNSNVYTIVYASVMVIIVAFLLAFVASALKEKQDANVAIDKKSQILASLNIRNVATENVEAEYSKIVIADPIYGATVDMIAEKDGFKVANKDIKADNRPLYVCEVEGTTKYVVPVKGAGLWGGISGYIALNDDCETVYGTYFTHESETAGLGARITEEWFQTSFNGKKIFANDNQEEVMLSVVKKGKEGTLSKENFVDGVTGATLTCNGVDVMIKDGIKLYIDVIKSLKK
ncbi:MAG: FMN-binding protein [Bacteroidaceae bacterium]|nr:FMN-binding protein [Bacteroidaceae bacterium]